MGANTALRDACELGVALSGAVGRNPEELQQILREYERKMLPRGREHVLSSRAVAEAENQNDLSGGRLERQAKEEREKLANSRLIT